MASTIYYRDEETQYQRARRGKTQKHKILPPVQVPCRYLRVPCHYRALPCTQPYSAMHNKPLSSRFVRYFRSAQSLTDILDRLTKRQISSRPSIC